MCRSGVISCAIMAETERHLPAEVVLLILQHAADGPTLCAAAQVCRTWRDVVAENEGTCHACLAVVKSCVRARTPNRRMPARSAIYHTLHAGFMHTLSLSFHLQRCCGPWHTRGSNTLWCRMRLPTHRDRYKHCYTLEKNWERELKYTRRSAFFLSLFLLTLPLAYLICRDAVVKGVRKQAVSCGAGRDTAHTQGPLQELLHLGEELERAHIAHEEVLSHFRFCLRSRFHT